MPITFHGVSFEWPNGNTVFNNLNLVLKDHRSGLVGVNGVGKSTLVHLAVGVLRPTSGKIESSGPVHLLSQVDERRSDEPAAMELAELDAFENELARRLIEKVPIERPSSTFSGGEWMKFRLARLAAAAHESFVILDEPTNHLDREGREAVIDFVQTWKGGLLVVSHDRELLEHVDEILELTPQGLTRVGGGWSEYDEFRRGERARLEHNLNVSKREREKARAERQRMIEQQNKRMAKGRRVALKGSLPRILVGGLKRRAQETAGRIDSSTLVAAEEAVRKAHEAFQALKVDPILTIKSLEVEKERIPNERLLVEAVDLNVRIRGLKDWLWSRNQTFSWRGPRRIAVRGPNGSGKSTLLTLLFEPNNVHNLVDIEGEIRRGPLRATFLRQDPLVNTQESIFELLRETSGLDETELRNQLARFLFNRERAEQPIASLSGGERLRAALAHALIGVKPEALVLDEPTNNLDLANIEYLEELLSKFTGALIVVSHDERFLEAINIEDELKLT